VPGIDLATRHTSALSDTRQARHVSASKLKIFVLAFAVILFNAAGNLSLAWGMKHVQEAVFLNPLPYLRAMLNPYVAFGIVLLSLWLLTRMALLSWADLSFVLPITGVGYVLAAVLGILFLNESITQIHWIGTLLVFAGTAMVGSTKQRTNDRSGVQQ
jgi:drug/metabolite transporter (DMT)-like permease